MLAKVELTARCNLNCMHCSASIYRPSPEWKTSQLLGLLEQLIDNGYDSFDLKGGEPFIRSDIFEILDFLERHDASFFLSTNGLLLDEEKIRRVLSYQRLSTFTVSLDGATKETHEAMRGKGTFHPTLEIIRRIAETREMLGSQIRFGLNYALTKVNYQEIKDVFHLADELGFSAVFVLCLSLIGNALEHKGDLFLLERDELAALKEGATVLRKIDIARQIRGLSPLEFNVELFPYKWKCRLMKWSGHYKGFITKNQCSAGVSEIYVGADGTIYPCEGVRVFLKMVEEEVGHYTRPSVWNYTINEARQEESFKKIVDFLHDYDRLFESIEPCNTCEHLRKCTICPLFARADGKVNRCTEEVLI
ncbi:MAG: radical SAM protein [Theionarchaea archaeon]|nr:radical SAM protein [Theionarchaea archaeon]MBU7037357.1 radical SAM protein [Theionarchaea archaeon]